MNIANPSLLKRNGAAFLDLFFALAITVLVFLLAGPSFYNAVYNPNQFRPDVDAILLETGMFELNEDTGQAVNINEINYPDAIYYYYSVFKDGKTYVNQDEFSFSNEWYNENILGIDSENPEENLLFTYDLDGEENIDSSLRGIEKDDADSEELSIFYQKKYDAILIDIQAHGPYLEIQEIIFGFILQTALIFLATVVFIFYFLIPIILGNGQTIFKRFFGIGIVSKEGYRIKPWQTTIRFLFFCVELVLSYFTIFGAILISYTMMMFSKNNRAAHDFIANTRAIDMKASIIHANADEAHQFQLKLEQEELNIKTLQQGRDFSQFRPELAVTDDQKNIIDNEDESKINSSKKDE